jgi:hypothetical protein
MQQGKSSAQIQISLAGKSKILLFDLRSMHLV